jgi:LSD1 subclass zinc finger protein
MRCFVVCESCETLFLLELSGAREIRTFRVEPRIEISR